MSRSQAVVTAQTSSASFFAGKNKIINGDFGINQRKFTNITTNLTYTYDRWLNQNNTGTVSATPQTFTAGAAPVAGYEGSNFMQMQISGQSASNAYGILSQRIEDGRTLAGQTFTYSFWARATSGTPKVALEMYRGLTVGTGSFYVGQVTLSTSWARYSITGTMPSLSGATVGADNFIEPLLWLSAGSDFNSRTGSIGIQNNTFQFWGMQLEAGSAATPFQTATGTFQGELAACQRYYYRTTANAVFDKYGWAHAPNTTSTLGMIQLAVPMRVTPTALDYASIDMYLWGTGGYTPTAVTLNSESTANVAVIESTGMTGLTQNRMYAISAGANTSYLGFSAEL